MESTSCKLPPFKLVPACSFKASLHPQYESIKTECNPWILSFIAPASHAASQFWLGCAFPLLCCLAYAHCTTQRVVHLVKLMTWLFISDSDDDDPSARGCEADLASKRHELLLACYAGHPNLDALAADTCSKGALTSSNYDSDMMSTSAMASGEVCDQISESDANLHKITKGLDVLHDIWKDISKDMSQKMLSRYLKATRDHLNANRLQAHYRKAGHLPGVEEYVYELRRPTSLLIVCFILLEYGLGIELDDETLGSETMMQLHDAVTDHVALVNDVFSCEVEKCMGDNFNLPCVILRERAAAEPGFTFADAMQEAMRMIEEVDRVCVQLIKEVKNSKLIEKPGVRGYLQGLECWMAGNVEWSLKTARYSHTCSAEGVVLSLENSIVYS